MDAPAPLTVDTIMAGWQEPFVYECPDCPARIAIRGPDDNLHPATRMYWHMVHAHDADERCLVPRAP
jgi:hypothetical protein